ncbi:uncharacterized protein [Paralichthys olivaceus]|uniref:uncharacterized protein isoform X1 n=1 Tax=Paralichthys olivaceus TaxID=8255 RepID=UPI003752FDFA
MWTEEKNRSESVTTADTNSSKVRKAAEQTRRDPQRDSNFSVHTLRSLLTNLLQSGDGRPRSHRTAFPGSSAEKRFSCSGHSSLLHRGLCNQQQWDHPRCDCSHCVHHSFTCSLCRPVEVHGVAATTKAQQGEGEIAAEEFCVKTGSSVQQAILDRNGADSNLRADFAPPRQGKAPE